MITELMTTAVCWDMEDNVSAEYAHCNKELYYFCPEPNCLEEVKAVKKTNNFFRAPNRHVAGCANEKESTESSPIPGEQRKIAPAVQPTIIPSHLGGVPALRKKATPNREEMLKLAEKVKSSPAIHPGTLQDVVDAWKNLRMDDRRNHRLHINNQASNYFDAFVPLSHATANLSSTNWSSTILFGTATVEFFNGSFYIKTFSKLINGNIKAPLRVRVRPGQSYFDLLKDDETITLFIHSPIPTLEAKRRFFEIQASTQYTGFAIG